VTIQLLIGVLFENGDDSIIDWGIVCNKIRFFAKTKCTQLTLAAFNPSDLIDQ